MITLFYITTAILTATLLFAILYEYLYGRELKDASLRLRRELFVAFFGLLLVAIVSRFFIVEDGQIEILPTMTTCLDLCAFVAFSMLADGYFGRKHYKNPYNWFFMLQLPVLLILLHLFMRFTGCYSPFFHLQDMSVPEFPYQRMAFMVRVTLLAIIFIAYVFLIILLLNAYLYNRKQRIWRISDLENQQTQHEQGNILMYVIMVVLMNFSSLFGSAAFHIVCNVLMTALVLWSVCIFTRFVKYTRLKLQGSFAATVIEDQLKKIIYQEKNNPLYASNASLDDVAVALKVEREDLSDYIYNVLGSSFSAWVSDKKLLLCTYLLKNTDRMISDIALSAGYKNVSAMNKAFKALFGMTPSEYRNEEKPRRLS